VGVVVIAPGCVGAATLRRNAANATGGPTATHTAVRRLVMSRWPI
jgi:hypothetical protein